MLGERHLMICTEGDGAQSFFECTIEGCGRRVVYDHVAVRLVVLDRGSASTLHQGSNVSMGSTSSVDSGLIAQP